MWAFRNARKKLQYGFYYASHGNDLSDYEEKGDPSFLIEIGKTAATNAVNENIAMNIPVTFLENGWVVRRMPQGNVERVAKIINQPGAIRNRKLTKGTVLHVKNAH